MRTPWSRRHPAATERARESARPGYPAARVGSYRWPTEHHAIGPQADHWQRAGRGSRCRTGARPAGVPALERRTTGSKMRSDWSVQRSRHPNLSSCGSALSPSATHGTAPLTADDGPTVRHLLVEPSCKKPRLSLRQRNVPRHHNGLYRRHCVCLLWSNRATT